MFSIQISPADQVTTRKVKCLNKVIDLNSLYLLYYYYII